MVTDSVLKPAQHRVRPVQARVVLAVWRTTSSLLEERAKFVQLATQLHAMAASEMQTTAPYAQTIHMSPRMPADSALQPVQHRAPLALVRVAQAASPTTS